jgi:uncharacterized protein YegP (UPF0339 family)
MQSTMRSNGGARRVTIYKDSAGKYRYRVQGFNWRTINASEQGFAQKRSVVGRVAREYPGVEVIDET